MKKIIVKTGKNTEFINITSKVQKIINEMNIENGILTIFVPHTTAAVTINENADPDVLIDMKYKLDDLIPIRDNYLHFEGNSHAHLKSSLIGVDQTIIIENGKLQLGIWQSIYFCEFDGPRSREVWIQGNV